MTMLAETIGFQNLTDYYGYDDNQNQYRKDN